MSQCPSVSRSLFNKLVQSSSNIEDICSYSQIVNYTVSETGSQLRNVELLESECRRRSRTEQSLRIRSNSSPDPGTGDTDEAQRPE